MRLSTQNNSGFTIVETLLVLAIAGLILLIVFDAIPALERNSRNNERRQDVAAILEEVSHYELNHSGNMPSECGFSGAAVANCIGTASNSFINPSKLTYYNSASGIVEIHVLDNDAAGNSSINTLSPPYVSNTEKVSIYNAAKCDASNDGSATQVGAGYNDVVALYAVETSSSYTSQCEAL